jgi:beta-lactamase class A
MKNFFKKHLIYIAIIMILLGSNVWWVKHSYDHDLAAEHYVQHVKDHPLLDPALPFYESKDLIVNVQELRKYLKSLPETNKDWANMSIYFEVLNTGANVSIGTDEKIYPASLIKLPVGMIAMKKVENGEWSMDETKFELEIQDVDIQHPSEAVYEIGNQYPLRTLLESMLLKSDNTSYQMILKNLSEKELNTIISEVGLDTLFTDEGRISAKDYTRLLRALYSSTYLNETNSQLLLSLLNESKFDKFLKAGLPSEVKFSHKWGINESQNVYADSGIVYVRNRAYVISVIIQGKSKSQKEDLAKAEDLIKQIGDRSYKFVSNY